MPRSLLLLALSLVLACTPALAREKRLSPGDDVVLAPDEGLLVVTVDSDVALQSLTFKNRDRFLSGESLRGIDKGVTQALYVMPAGRYRWDRINLGWFTWIMRKDPEMHFEVLPGKITFAGAIRHRFGDYAHTVNHSLPALDFLREKHPALLERYGFHYVGHYPDLFPDFYRERLAARDGASAESLSTLRAPPAPGPLPLAVRELFRAGRISDVSISPDGRRVVAAIRDHDPDATAPKADGDGKGDGKASAETAGNGEKPLAWAIDLHDFAAGSVRRLARSEWAVESLQWAGPDVLLATLSSRSGAPFLSVFRFKPDGSHDWLLVNRPGNVIHTLPDDPDHVLFVSLSSRDEPLVSRLDISSQKAIDNFRFKVKDRLNLGLEGDQAWITDRAGNVRAAVVYRDEALRLMYGERGSFTEVMQFEAEEPFTPIGLSPDGRLVYGITEKDRAQRELVEFDPASKAITRTVYAKPGRDLVRGLFDKQGRLIGATYYQDGLLVADYFDEAGKQLTAQLQKAFPGRTVAVVERSAGGRQMALWVDGSDQPLQVYYLDLDQGRASLVDEAAPWLAGRTFAPTRALRVPRPDGFEVEAFLTLPTGPGKRPLVVMPHGGPIGVADRRHFDPEVQFLASLGYAVLQVNFRGSVGYGKAFREAAQRNYGTLIEDDIDAALQMALASAPLDADRMCMIGTSYGGYSSLVSSLRWPGRFRCAVSIAGVSDRLLTFTASDAARSEERRKLMVEAMGDPVADREMLWAASPLYHYEELATPLMLVHGVEDQRVDYEHMRRLVRMLNLAGRPPVGLVFKDEGHGVARIGNLETTWQGIAGFLRQHLDGQVAAPAPADATAPTP